MVEPAAKLHVEINLDPMLGNLQVEIRKATANVNFALAADVPPDFSPNQASGSGITYQLGGAETRTVPEVRDQFKSWVVGCALRDTLEAALLFLDEVRKIAAATTFQSAPQVRVADWIRVMEKDQEDFHRWGLKRKIAELQKISPTLEPNLNDQINSINLARNCLVHRLGRVGEIDVGATDALEVKWLANEIWGEIDGVETKLSIGHIAEAQTQLFLRQNVPMSKAFQRGETIQFTADEFSEIAWTVFVFASDLREKVTDLVRNSGIAFKDASAESSSAGA